MQARADRQKNMLAVWHVDSGKLIPLAHDLTEQVTPLRHQQLAYATNWDSYAMDRTIGQKIVTYDFARLMQGATEVSTSAFGDALIRNL